VLLSLGEKEVKLELLHAEREEYVLLGLLINLFRRDDL